MTVALGLAALAVTLWILGSSFATSWHATGAAIDAQLAQFDSAGDAAVGAAPLRV
ncbi:MAG TPA: hypothetical protein P5181_08025 [Dermatophilaceae bacterium]|nr:hypothetical protein [Dermatophilaceae bacterium]